MNPIYFENNFQLSKGDNVKSCISMSNLVLAIDLLTPFSVVQGKGFKRNIFRINSNFHLN